MPYKYCTGEREDTVNIHDLEKIPGHMPLYIFIPKKYHENVNFTPFKLKAGKIKTQYYFVKEGDNFKSRILHKAIGIPYSVLDHHGLYDKVVSCNTQIEDINKIHPGERLYIEYPKLYESKCRLPNENLEVREIASIPKTETSIENPESNEKYKLRYGAFYATSLGTYSESGSGLSIDAGQNSPATVGATVSTS